MSLKINKSPIPPTEVKESNLTSGLLRKRKVLNILGKIPLISIITGFIHLIFENKHPQPKPLHQREIKRAIAEIFSVRLIYDLFEKKAVEKPIEKKPAVESTALESIKIGNTSLNLIRGDITKWNGDIIVNAANNELQAGRGVCGAIHSAAGNTPFDECKAFLQNAGKAGILDGEAMLTGPGQLKNIKGIIHAVGPRGSTTQRQSKLEAAYLSSLQIAKDHHYRSIAFPSISTGIFDYPKEEAAEIAIKTIKTFIEQNPDTLDRIEFLFYNPGNPKDAEETLQTYAKQLQ